MNRCVTIHGHFYQPPRENPWLEDIEFQYSAQPYHDWNERITDECYAPNSASRILDSDRRIIDVVDNYSKISFNFGPTLLSWMEDEAPKVYEKIIEADKKSQDRYSGHGSAIAQPYNHMIMPLANERDKKTQIVWGIEDFKHRFGREPEGMWLPETAVDLKTLETMADHGIKFTILAPRQAKRFRKIGDEDWTDVSDEKIDPRRPYLCRLPSDNTINIFFYDGPISKDVGFGDILRNGDRFAERMMDAFSEEGGGSQIVNIATDGETYGHHHRFGDMTLARCLHEIDSNDKAELTIYGKYLENHTPEHEVEIFENTSWSCVHGVERWKSDCGCNTGTHGDWNQKWRAPLREGLNWLRDSLISIYESEIGQYLKDPWEARNAYIQVVLERSEANIDQFLAVHASKELSEEEVEKTLKLLEMQRSAMLMFTSCGWFFDEISGREPVQVLQYAARAVQLSKDFSDRDLEEEFLKILEKAPSNVPKYENGRDVYEELVEPTVVDLPRMGAHYAISSLFKDYDEEEEIHSFKVFNQMYELEKIGDQRLAGGKAIIRSNITMEEEKIAFAVLHMGGHNLMGGVLVDYEDKYFSEIFQEIKESFSKSNISETFKTIDKKFGERNYSLWHLFKDEQREILNQLLEPKVEEMRAEFGSFYDEVYPTVRAMREMQASPPKVIMIVGEYVLNRKFKELFRRDELDTERLKELAEEAEKGSFELHREMISYEASQKINSLLEYLEKDPKNISIMEQVTATLKILDKFNLDLNLWRAQNAYFSLGKSMFDDMRKRAEGGDEDARRWVDRFTELGNQLNVKIS